MGGRGIETEGRETEGGESEREACITWVVPKEREETGVLEVCWKLTEGCVWSGSSGPWTLGGGDHLRRVLGAETHGEETVGRPMVVPRQREGRARRAPHHLWCLVNIFCFCLR